MGEERRAWKRAAAWPRRRPRPGVLRWCVASLPAPRILTPVATHCMDVVFPDLTVQPSGPGQSGLQDRKVRQART